MWRFARIFNQHTWLRWWLISRPVRVKHRNRKHNYLSSRDSNDGQSATVTVFCQYFISGPSPSLAIRISVVDAPSLDHFGLQKVFVVEPLFRYVLGDAVAGKHLIDGYPRRVRTPTYTLSS